MNKDSRSIYTHAKADLELHRSSCTRDISTAEFPPDQGRDDLLVVERRQELKDTYSKWDASFWVKRWIDPPPVHLTHRKFFRMKENEVTIPSLSPDHDN